MRRGGDIMRLTFRKECVKISPRGKTERALPREGAEGRACLSVVFLRKCRAYFAAYTPSMSVPSRYSTAAMSLS